VACSSVTFIFIVHLPHIQQYDYTVQLLMWFNPFHKFHMTRQCLKFAQQKETRVDTYGHVAEPIKIISIVQKKIIM